MHGCTLASPVLLPDSLVVRWAAKDEAQMQAMKPGVAA